MATTANNWWDSGYSPIQPAQYGGGPDYLASIENPAMGGMNWGGGGTGGEQPGAFSMQGIFGGTSADGTKTNGWGGAALGVAQGLGNAYMAMKQYGLAKDTLKFSKEQFYKNFGAQQKMTNSRLEDRQRARVASNSGAYQSVGDYMKQYGV